MSQRGLSFRKTIFFTSTSIKRKLYAKREIPFHMTRKRNNTPQSLTVFFCSFIPYRTLWSITDRSEGQHLKFIFCVLNKPSDISNSGCSIINSCYSCWSSKAFSLIKEFKSYDDSISGICWW